MRNVGIGVGVSGNHELGFRVLSLLKGPSEDERSSVFFAYAELREAEGKHAALDWLKTRIPPLDSAAANWTYQLGVDDLLWEYIDETPGRANLDQLHVLRAAACIRAPSPDAARRAEVLEYAHKAPPENWGAAYPRYLLGETDESAILASIGNLDGIGSAAWAIGARKAGERRLAEASDWFQVVMETGSQHLPPIGFAYEAISKWTQAEEPLDVLAARRAP